MIVETAGDWQSRFQAAALDPSQWVAALRELAEATGSSRGQLIGLGGAGSVPFNWITDMDMTAFDDAAQIEGHLPTNNFRIAASLGADPRAILHEAHYDEARRTLTSDDYLDLCEKYGIPFGCQATIASGTDSAIGLAMLRTRADGRTTDAQRQVFADAVPFVRSAVLMQHAIEHQGFHLLAGTLEAMSLACLLLDGLGRVQGMTPAAEAVIGAEPLLRLTDSRLSSADAGERQRIDAAIRSVLQPGQPGHARVPICRGGSVATLVVDMFRLPPRDWAMHFAPCAIVVLRDRKPDMVGGAAVLATAFGLTRAETQVALGLCEGHSRERIAAARGVSPETLKVQLRSIYQKTGCSREVELVLMVKALLD